MMTLIKSYKDITDVMEKPSRTGVELVKRAYEFAQEAHLGQKRYSGEPYFNHPYETALILAELGMGATSLSAGLLHDTIEDTQVTDEKLKEEFGEEIHFLVTGVTKLGTIRFKGSKRHTESLRKLFVATSEDIRVLIIKLADRLHNMRTLEYVPETKRLRIANETMEVYAPIAYRLGMGKIKGELEDLSFKYLDPEAYEKVIELSKDKFKKSEEKLEKLYGKLRSELKEEKIQVISTDYRRKHLYSIYRKLRRKDWDIERIYDISALRIIVPNVSDCYRVLGVVHSVWRPLPTRIKDYIAFPKPNGYKSIHTTIFTGEGSIAEIQIRTEKMHKEAEYGIASHVRYHGNKGSFFTANWFVNLLPGSKGGQDSMSPKPEVPEWIKEMASTQTEVSRPTEFMTNLRSDFFESRIFAFTPKGDVIDLPSGSSPVDFAYMVHSDLGDHITAVKINGKMSAISTLLHNGDVVEIQTNKKSRPTQKWLSYAKTTNARRRIRAAIQKAKESPNY